MRNPAFTFNVFLRPLQLPVLWYGHAAADLTFDHVVPRSRGGRTTWTNVGVARSPCNLSSNKLPEQCGMQPLSKPVAPNIWQLQENGRGFPPNYLQNRVTICIGIRIAADLTVRGCRMVRPVRQSGCRAHLLDDRLQRGIEHCLAPPMFRQRRDVPVLHREAGDGRPKIAFIIIQTA